FLVPGFAMRLIDIEIGKEREFDVQAPDNTSDPEMAGATGKAYVTVTEIKEKILPALDDAFAKTMGYDDVATLMDKTRSSLLKEREEAARNRLIDQILDAIAGVSTVSFPDILVDRQTEKMINDRAAVLKQQGIDMPLYLRLLGMTMDEMRAQVRNQAEKRIRNYLLVEELSRAEGIVVEDAAVAAEIERLAADMQDPEAARRALSTNEMHDQVKDRLALDRLFDRLIAIVTEGQEPVAPSSESALPSVTDTVMADEEQKENEPEQPKLIIATH
ncbi:MAG: hypothetical protein ABIN58_03070, partial [candidate division WOR-3 bacterium]